MRKTLISLISICVFAVVAIAAAPEVAKLDKCQKRKPPVVFPHKKHTEMKIDCKVCHHKYEGKGEPRSCFTCHKCEKGEAPSAKKAFHKNCIKCHKKEKKGPRKCAQCHKK